MREFLSLAISGAVSGALYAIVASGLVLTYQTSGILNFAHGAVAFVCAFLFYELHQPSAEGGLGLPIVPAAILTVAVFAPLLGWFLDRVMLRKLAGAPETARVVGTVGLLVAMPALAIFVVERLNAVLDAGLPSNDQVFSPPGLGPRPRETWSISEGVVIDSDQIGVFVAAAFAAVGLWFVLRRTRLGLEMRAGVDRAPLAQLRGVDTDRVGAISWMSSFLLAGLAGVLIAPLFDLEPFTYNLIVFAAFTAVVLAGMRSIPVAFAGGLLLGVVQNLVYGYAPDVLVEISGFRSVLPYVLLLLFLLAASGRSAGTARSPAEERPPPDPRAGLTPVQRRMPWALATAALAVYVWFAADDFWASLTARGLALGLVFLSFVVVTGIGGMISLAQAAFVTTGAFTAGWLVNHQWPQTMPVLMNDGRLTFGVAALAAAVVAALVGVVVALPSLRLGGLALALATLALAFIGDRLVFQVESVRNGSGGWSVPAPSLGPLDFAEPRPMATLLLGLCLLVTFAIANLLASSSGRAMLAVRSTEVAARTAGISPIGTKLALFAISAAIAGFGGAMYAAVTSPFTNTTAPAIAGIFWLAVTVTFGVRRAAGAVLAGLAVAMAPPAIDWLTSSTFAWRVVFLLAAAAVAGFVLGAVLDRVAHETFVARGEWASTVVSAVAMGSLLVAAVASSNAFLYLALVAAGVLLGLPGGAAFAQRPGARAPVGLLVAAGIFAAPQLVTWFADAATAADVVDDAIGSAHLPSILFGLGAISLATNPDGVLAMTSERRRAQREAPERRPPAPVRTGEAGPAPSPGPAGDGGAPPVLRIDGVVAGWGDVEVLHGVDLDVPAGAIVALLGANGAGKSTLCGVIGGTLPAWRGRVVLDGRDVTGEPAFRRARSGLVLLPESRGIFPGLSVAENLEIWLPAAADRDRAYARFPVLGDRRAQLAGNLSGGEQQMLALVPALERPPRVLVADEPTLGLAPMAVEGVFQALAELRDLGVALLVVEEKARDVVDVADTVTLVELGRVRWSGPREDADPDRLAAAYLGT